MQDSELGPKIQLLTYRMKASEQAIGPNKMT